MYYSIPKKATAYVDGVLLFDEPRPNDSNTADMTVFNFPPSSASGGLDADGYGSDWTVGEFIVVRGTISDEALEKTESYLSSKWSIPLDRTMEKKFSDNSGGNRNLLYSGQEISPDNKFNSTIAFNGSTVSTFQSLGYLQNINQRGYSI